ncbi:unnamed protein product [Linum trigynum]|uniref:Uncharacterized protein n=1 Tax=Linum trigynum TaxID=586398 RepID=A0AAV2GJI2_9ROSI
MAAMTSSASSLLVGEGRPPDPIAGSLRPLEVSSSSDEKKDRESQHPKKRVLQLELINDQNLRYEVIVEDIMEDEMRRRKTAGLLVQRTQNLRMAQDPTLHSFNGLRLGGEEEETFCRGCQGN